MSKIKWGILSTGTIAHTFAQTLLDIHGESAYAVASRSQESGEKFGKTYNIPHTYRSYQELMQNPEIDIVYIGTPHSLHYENMMLALEHGKHILCEKTFTVSAEEAKHIFTTAKEKNLFVMEAFWTRFIPVYQKIKDLIADDIIGEVEAVTAQYGYTTEGARQKRKFDPQLAGGALLDIGVYNVGFATMFLGYYPKDIHSSVRLHPCGTDEHSGILLSYPNGSVAHLLTSLSIEIPVLGCIYGSKGYIKIPEYKNPSHITVHLNTGETLELDQTYSSSGFEFEILEAERCIQKNLIESPLLTGDQSIAVMNILDKVRALWGMTFPFEK